MILDQLNGETHVCEKKSNRTYPCINNSHKYFSQECAKIIVVFAENGLADAIMTNYMKKIGSNKGNLYIELTETM